MRRSHKGQSSQTLTVPHPAQDIECEDDEDDEDLIRMGQENTYWKKLRGDDQPSDEEDDDDEDDEDYVGPSKRSRQQDDISYRAPLRRRLSDASDGSERALQHVRNARQMMTVDDALSELDQDNTGDESPYFHHVPSAVRATSNGRTVLQESTSSTRASREAREFIEDRMVDEETDHTLPPQTPGEAQARQVLRQPVTYDDVQRTIEGDTMDLVTKGVMHPSKEYLFRKYGPDPGRDKCFACNNQLGRDVRINEQSIQDILDVYLSSHQMTDPEPCMLGLYNMFESKIRIEQRRIVARNLAEYNNTCHELGQQIDREKVLEIKKRVVPEWEKASILYHFFTKTHINEPSHWVSVTTRDLALMEHEFETSQIYRVRKDDPSTTVMNLKAHRAYMETLKFHHKLITTKPDQYSSNASGKWRGSQQSEDLFTKNIPVLEQIQQRHGLLENIDRLL